MKVSTRANVITRRTPGRRALVCVTLILTRVNNIFGPPKTEYNVTYL